MKIKMKKYYVLYHILFLSFTTTPICLLAFFDSPKFNYLVPAYFVIVFGAIFIRYITVLFKVSREIRKSYPSIYKKYKGLSQIGNVTIVRPTIAFEAQLQKEPNKLQSIQELRTLLLLLVLSFLSGIVLALVIVI